MAYILGITSPSNNNTRVINITSNKNFNASLIDESLYNLLKRALDNMTIPTFRKLFKIRIVASKSLGLSSNLLTKSAFLLSSFFKVSLSLGLSEKNEASDHKVWT